MDPSSRASLVKSLQAVCFQLGKSRLRRQLTDPTWVLIPFYPTGIELRSGKFEDVVELQFLAKPSIDLHFQPGSIDSTISPVVLEQIHTEQTE
jgi:hypothetical protein